MVRTSRASVASLAFVGKGGKWLWLLILFGLFVYNNIQGAYNDLAFMNHDHENGCLVGLLAVLVFVILIY